MKPRHALRREDRRARPGRQIRTPAQILAEDYGMSPRQIDEVTHKREPSRHDPKENRP